jgi:hypothetical protein
MHLQLYNDIKKWITDRLPEVKNVRLYNNQFNREDVESAFLYPVIFISFPQTTYTNRLHRVQEAHITMTIHIGFQSLKDEDTSILQLKQDIHKCIVSFISDNFSYPKRVSDRENFDHDNVHLFEIDYELLGVDWTNDDRIFKTITATPVIDVSFTQSQYTPVPQTSTLTVTIEDGSGNPIEGATITLKLNGTTYSSDSTDSNGQAVFEDLEYDDYTIDVTSTGYNDNLNNIITIDEETEVIKITMTTTTKTYYIASTGDIYGAAMPVIILNTTTLTSSTLIELSDIYEGNEFDMIVTGCGLTDVIQAEYQVLSIDYPNIEISDIYFKPNLCQRFAKLTEFTSADFTNKTTGINVRLQRTYFPGVDVSSIFPAGSKVKIVTGEGDIYYDIVYECIYKSGNTNMSCYIGQYVINSGEAVDVYLMTNII